MSRKKDNPSEVLSRNNLVEIMKSAGIRGWSVNQINTKLKEFATLYGISPDNFFKREIGDIYEEEHPSDTELPEEDSTANTRLNIDKDTKDLFLLLVTTFPLDPFIATKEAKLDMTSIGAYYQAVIEKLNEPSFDPVSRHELTNSTPYIQMLIEKQLIDKVVQKLSQLAAASMAISHASRNELWLNLFQTLDDLIYDAYEIEQRNIFPDPDYIFSTLEEPWRNLQQKVEQLKSNHELTPEKIKHELENSPEFRIFEMRANIFSVDYLAGKTGPNFSSFLADKLKKKLEDSITADKIVYDHASCAPGERGFFDSNTVKSYMDMVNSIKTYIERQKTDVDPAAFNSIIMTRQQQLIQEANVNLDGINKFFADYKTYKEEVEESIKNVSAGSPPTFGDPKPLEYYEGFLKFYAEISQEAEKYKDAVRGIVEQPLVNRRKNK